MSSKINYSVGLEAAMLNAITTAVGNAGKLWIYGGTQPAGPDVASHGQTLLAGPFILGSPFASGATTSAVPSVLSPTLPANVFALATGTPTWYRVTTSAGTDGAAGLIDGSAGVASSDLTIGGSTSGQPVAITSWTITSTNNGH